MTSNPRAALDRLVAALERHLVAAGARRGEADPVVVAAYQTLADAFEDYDEALYTAYDEVTPFVLYDDVEDEDEDDDDEDDEDSDADEDEEDDDLETVEGDHDDEAGDLDEDEYEIEPHLRPQA
jgi:hypothetical protein